MQLSSQQRRDEVFRAIVREYLASAEPVGSETIVSKYQFGVSPATIRNDMADLEEQELLAQPHTSAGRIPTEEGYRFYVHRFIDGQEVIFPKGNMLAAMAREMERDAESSYKAFAKMLASMTGETVFLRLGDETTYLTGTSHLLQKPESRNEEMLIEVSLIIDDLDAVLDAAEERVTRDRDIEIFIGRQNPFGSRMTSIITKCTAPGIGDSMIGIIGPQRMDYDVNVPLIKFVHDLLEMNK